MASSGGPACTTCPPRSPAPGPSSSMKSDCRIAARSCSTTTTVLPISRSRRRRARVGRHQCFGNIPSARPSSPADIQQDQSRRYADSDACAHFEGTSALPGGGPRGYPTGAEDFAGARGRSRQHQRRPEACRADPGQPDRSRSLRSEHGGSAYRLPRPTSTRRKATSTARSRHTRSAQTISCSRARTMPARSSPIATALRYGCQTWPRWSTTRRNPAGRMDELRLPSSSIFSGSRAQTSSMSSTASAAAAAVEDALPSSVKVTILTDRTKTIRASVKRRAVRADADRSRWW